MLRRRSKIPHRRRTRVYQLVAAFLGAFCAVIVAFVIAMNPQWLDVILRQKEGLTGQNPKPVAVSPEALKSDLMLAPIQAVEADCNMVTFEKTTPPPSPAGTAAPSLLPKLAQPAPPAASTNDQTPDDLQDVLNAPDGYNPANDLQASAEPAGTKTNPTLLKDSATGAVTVGNFKASKVNGDNQQGAAIGRSMLTDSGMSATGLQTVLDTKFIVIERICAANSSVILTCATGALPSARGAPGRMTAVPGRTRHRLAA